MSIRSLVFLVPSGDEARRGLEAAPGSKASRTVTAG